MVSGSIGAAGQLKGTTALDHNLDRVGGKATMPTLYPMLLTTLLLKRARWNK
jgi:hypothetical protein